MSKVLLVSLSINYGQENKSLHNKYCIYSNKPLNNRPKYFLKIGIWDWDTIQGVNPERNLHRDPWVVHLNYTFIDSGLSSASPPCKLSPNSNRI